MKCQYCHIKKATSMIRTCDVCGKCFLKFKKDDKKRIDIEIKTRDCDEVREEKEFIIKNRLNNIPHILILLDEEIKFLKKKEVRLFGRKRKS